MAESITTTELMSRLFDEKIVEILRLVLRKKDIFYLRDLSRESGVSLATVYRITQKCLEAGIVRKDKEGKTVFYRVDRKSPAFQAAYELIIGKPEDIRKVLQREIGSNAKIFFKKGDKGKVFVVGKNLNKDILKTKVEKVSIEAGIALKALFLSPEQFSEMREMGLVICD
jgi:DNA-binding transcriptional ArsR family regulator